MIKLLIYSVILSFYAHDYHISIFDIDFKEKQFQISCKVFADDLKASMAKRGYTLKGEGEEIGDDLHEALESFILENFMIKTDNDYVKLSYVGAEWEDYHNLYIYLESPEMPGDFRALEIENSVFLDVNSEQQNMHHLNINGHEKTLLLKNGKREGKIFLPSN